MGIETGDGGERSRSRESSIGQTAIARQTRTAPTNNQPESVL